MLKMLLLTMSASALIFVAFIMGIINFPMALIGVVAIGILTMRRISKINY